MRERYDGNFENGPIGPPGIDGARSVDFGRLEEVGDLHFHAFSFSSALDYYQQVYNHAHFDTVPVDGRLRILRKGIDCLLLTGQFFASDRLLMEADELVVAECPQAHRAVERALFQVRRAIYLRSISQFHDCLRMAKRAFAVLALTDEHREVARLQATMGIVHHRLGRLEKAEEFYNDSLATYRRIGFDLGVANVMNNLALLKKNACQWGAAQNLLEKATTLANQIGASHLLPGFYLNQGIVLIKSNRHGEARPFLNKGLSMANSLGDRLHQCRLKLALGRLESLSGRQARAEEYLLSAKALAEENSYRRESVIADEYLGDVLLSRGLAEKALFNYELGLEKSRNIASGNDLEGELLRRMGEAHLLAGRFQDAVAVSQASIAVCEQCEELYEMGFCHLTLARSYTGLKDRKQLAYHFQEAISVFREQKLVRQWCESILAYAELRLQGADTEELLTMRRYLMDAQEKGASSVSDSILCRVLEALAQVQMGLRQYDDALLSVFELERHAAGLESAEWNSKVIALRDRIEVGLVEGVDDAGSHMLAISGIPGIFADGDGSVPGNLEAVLQAGIDRVEADSGFIAMTEDGRLDGNLNVVSRAGLTENLAEQLCRWFSRQPEGSGVRYFSRLGAGDDLLDVVPALGKHSASCLFMPISSGSHHFGFIFLGKKAASGQAVGFGRNCLDFLSTYMGFLALFLREKGHAGNVEVSTPIQRVKSFESIITQSKRMLEVLGLARKVAPSDLTVLLNGETGTGKGLLAYSIHALSQRVGKKFVQINCAAIPEALLESELFGHVKGAFTGADGDKVGLLASAEGGTVFLDEIGKMPLAMQGKLLQFLDTKVVRPVGGTQEKIVDVRLVAASKSDLHRAALEGRFLEDLYYRLVDFPLAIPPLRERADDVQLLTRHFAQRFGMEISGQLPAIDQDFMAILCGYAWPGNVRELEKTMKRAIVLSQQDGVLRPEHLPRHMVESMDQDPSAGMEEVFPLRDTLAGVEVREISRALDASEGNKSAAARLLKVSYPTLLSKIRHYGIILDS